MFGLLKKKKKPYYHDWDKDPHTKIVVEKVRETGKYVRGYVDEQHNLIIEVDTQNEPDYGMPRASMWTRINGKDTFCFSKPVRGINNEHEQLVFKIAAKLRLPEVGYYGPTNAHGSHLDNQRFDTVEEARLAYIKYWGTDQGEGINLEPGYWKKDWGPVNVGDQPSWYGYAWGLMDYVVHHEGLDVKVETAQGEWICKIWSSAFSIEERHPKLAWAICKAFVLIPDAAIQHPEKYRG